MTTQAQPLNEFHFETLDELMADTPHQRNHAQHIVDTIHRTLWLKEQFKGRSEHDVLTYVETNGDGAERGAKLGTTVRKSLGEGSFGGLRPIETCFATSFYVSTDTGSLDNLVRGFSCGSQISSHSVCCHGGCVGWCCCIDTGGRGG